MEKQKIDFLKYTLPNTLESIEISLRKGEIIIGYEKLKSLQTSYWNLFQFKYGSEMNDKNYSDENVVK